jgi:hypothetical protein
MNCSLLREIIRGFQHQLFSGLSSGLSAAIFLRGSKRIALLSRRPSAKENKTPIVSTLQIFGVLLLLSARRGGWEVRRQGVIFVLCSGTPVIA